jgi:hypothetical protein
MFADGAGISLSLHVPASSEGERRDCGGSLITYRNTEYSRSFLVYIYIYIYMYIYKYIYSTMYMSTGARCGYTFI